VISTEPATRRVVVGRGEELLRASMHVKDVNWISIASPVRADARRSEDPQQAQRRERNDFP
jgi:tRNA U34 2-thiouridine synthase MnmA/TrmU